MMYPAATWAVPGSRASTATCPGPRAVRRRIEKIVPTTPLMSRLDEPIYGVETHDELRVAAPLGQMERLLHLLRDHEAHVPARLEGTHDHFVPPHVELLDHLALDVDLTGSAEPPGQRGVGQLSRDQLAGHR